MSHYHVSNLKYVPVFLQHLNGSSVSQPIRTGPTFRLEFSVYPPEFLHSLDDGHRVLFYQRFVRQNLILLVAAIQLGRGQNVGQSSKPERQQQKGQ